MIKVSTIMRILRGMNVRSTETVAELNETVNTRAAHMTAVFNTTFVTASVLQIPKTCLKMGLLRHRPSMARPLVADGGAPPELMAPLLPRSPRIANGSRRR